MVTSPTASEASTRLYPLVVSSTPIAKQDDDENLDREPKSLNKGLEALNRDGALAPLSDPQTAALPLDGSTRHGASNHPDNHQHSFTENPVHGGTPHQHKDYRYPVGSPAGSALSFNISPPMYAPPTMLPLPHSLGPSHSVPPPYPRFRYPSMPASPFPPSATSNYAGQAPNPHSPPSGLVYYAVPDKRYAPMYQYPYAPHLNAHGHPAPQHENPGQLFYPIAYPHSFPQSPSTSGGNTTPSGQPNSHATPTYWSPIAPQLPYNYNHNPYHFTGTQPMQQSSSQHNARTTSQQTIAYSAPAYPRRHSHPVKQLTQHPNGPDGEKPHEHGWNARQKALSPSGSHGHISRGQTRVSPQSNMQQPSAAPPFTPQQNLPSDFLHSPLLPAGNHPALPRGPPRKPRQSGHALWVGNLPPGTSVIELKDNFSSGATETIESVFLISKSNCAFINYKTDAACSEAMGRFHDSRFKGVRLVCRLRRNSSASSALQASAADGDGAVADGAADGEATAPETPADGAAAGGQAARTPVRESLKDRIFIFKSLTVEDLDLSVKNGVWATQLHNEDVLNRAFETSANVYLIFSANKSGEYYGYARMRSSIPDESIQDVRWSHTAAAGGADDGLPEAPLPKSIYTPATATAPAGRIVDDSARGTIFWEAAAGDAGGDAPASAPSAAGGEDGEELGADAKAWGKPFRIEWISTSKIPFYKTRGLRNAWNSNREVKIARDGTEVESSVGKRLLHMFHRGVNAPTRAPHANAAAGPKHRS